jgi:hypothetical protein
MEITGGTRSKTEADGHGLGVEAIGVVGLKGVNAPSGGFKPTHADVEQ